MLEAVKLETFIGAIAGIVTIVILAYKKMNDIKIPDVKREHADLIAVLKADRDDANRLKSEAVAELDKVKAVNEKLENQVHDLKLELELMKNRVTLLAQLNNMLSSTLEETRGRLDQLLADQSAFESSSLEIESMFPGDAVAEPLPITDLGKEIRSL